MRVGLARSLPEIMNLTQLASTVGLTLLGIAVGHVVGAVWFLRRLRADQPPALPADGDCPKAAVLLSLRGNDPHLRDTVRSLLQQDYPAYELHVIVDSRLDPAWDVVAQEIQASGATNVRLASLEPLTTCTLPCSALVQFVDGLDESFELVANADADTVPDPSWLRRLAAELVDARVGVASGQSFYIPDVGQLGSMVRSVWFGGALVVAFFRGHPWAGSMALRLSDVRDWRMSDTWRHAAVDDLATRDAVQGRGNTVAMVPSLILVNREECTLRHSVDYFKRTLFWSALYDGTRPVTLTLSVTTVVLLVAAMALTYFGVVADRPGIVARAVTGMVGLHVTVLVLHLRLVGAVSRLARARNETTKGLSLRSFLTLNIAIPLSWAVYAVAAVSAAVSRRITWRQVTYEVGGPFDVQVLEHRPYREGAPGRAGDSL